MAELYTILHDLGLEQYLEDFLEEGFDKWTTLLDITEDDLYCHELDIVSSADAEQ
jgi:hypothetical protein